MCDRVDFVKVRFEEVLFICSELDQSATSVSFVVLIGCCCYSSFILGSSQLGSLDSRKLNSRMDSIGLLHRSDGVRIVR